MMENDDHIFGPNITLDAGKYVAEITGSNLSELSFDIYNSTETSVIPYDYISITDTKVLIYFTLNEAISSVEIRTIKNGSTFTFNSLKVYTQTTSNSIVPTGSHTLTAEYIDNIAPTGTVQVSVNGAIVTANVSAIEEGSGISQYGYLIQKDNTTCPTSGYAVSNYSNYIFNLSESGTYTVCVKVIDNASNIGYISSSEFNVVTSLTVNINGAISDTITITDSGGSTVDTISTDDNGKATATLNFGSYTFNSNVAKSTSDLSVNYSKTVTFSSNTSVVNVYPEGAVYWYGNGDETADDLYLKTNGITSDYKETNRYYSYYHATSTSVHGNISTVTNVLLLKSDSTKYSKINIVFETGYESRPYWCYNGSCYQSTVHLVLSDSSSNTELLNTIVSSLNTKTIYTSDLTSSTYSSVNNMKIQTSAYAGNGMRSNIIVYAIWLE